jgi:hypothetical protein
MQMRIAVGIGAALAAWLTAGGAAAATLNVTTYTLGEQVRIAAGATRGTVNTAEFKVGLDGEEGFSYCVDLAQNIGLGASTGWSVVSPESNAGVIRAAWLVDHFHTSAPSRAAITGLQLAIWETLAEAGSSTGYDLYSGAFALESNGASSAATALARSFLGELAAADLTGYFTSADWAKHTKYQDQLVFTNPIPEPSTVLMFALGAALVGVVTSRKQI